MTKTFGLKAQLLALFLSFIFAGCQYDPHAHLLTTTQPAREDVIGVYVADQFFLPPGLAGKPAEMTVELRADGTFTATNVPPWNLSGPEANFFETLVSGKGEWEIDSMGQLDPGAHKIWGVYLRDAGDKIQPPHFTGKGPPYGLIFTLGDPDSGDAILLKKKS